MQLATSAGQSFCSAHGDPCGGFMAIPPLVRTEYGSYAINPDFDYVKRFFLNAAPYGGGEGTLGPGESRDFAFTVPAEENHLGDLLVSELRASFRTAVPQAVTGIFTEFLSLQSDRLFMNAPVANTLLWGDGFLNCCMPCCTLIQATNTVIMRVTNTEAVPVECFFTAVGKRFLPYHYPELRSRYLSYWNQIPCTPFYLTLDNQQVQVGPGDTVSEFMTVPGGGDFEAMWPRLEVITGAGTDPDNDIRITLTEGVGRAMENVPTLAVNHATRTRAVAGFPNGGTYAASQACPCPQPTQLFKRNSRMRVTITNNGADAATIRYTWAGCMHYAGECPPGRSLDRIRSLEPTIGPNLVGSDRCPPWQQAEPVPGQGFVPINGDPARQLPPAIPGPATGGPLQVPGMYGGGVRTAQPGGPSAYLSKYYTQLPDGRVVPINAAAHGLAGGGHQWARL